MTITIKEGRFYGEVKIDPTKESGARWMWTITENTFPGNKHADPDFITHTRANRTYTPALAVADCINEIEALNVEIPTKEIAQAIADYCPFEVSA